jgi:hypothetical protein
MREVKPKMEKQFEWWAWVCLSWFLIGRSAVNQSLQDDQVLPDIYQESLRCPTPSRLDDVQHCAVLGQGGSSSHSHRLPSYTCGEMSPQLLDKPRPGGY